jgi:DNA-binding HxlR family transcriptional regulator
VKKTKTCEAYLALELIRGRWKLLILRQLRKGTQRTGQLARALDGVARNRLNENLRELERTGVIQRAVYKERVLRVEYGLTDLGNSLCPIIESLHRWGRRNKEHLSGNVDLRKP